VGGGEACSEEKNFGGRRLKEVKGFHRGPSWGKDERRHEHNKPERNGMEKKAREGKLTERGGGGRGAGGKKTLGKG